MAITAKRDRGEFVPHPEGGPFAAVLARVALFEGVETQFGVKDRVQLVFQTTERLRDHSPAVTDERPMEVSVFVNRSLNRRSRLLELVSVQVPQAQLDRLLADGSDFDLEQLIGTQWQLQIEHVTRDGRTYVNVKSLMRGAKGQRLPVWGAEAGLGDLVELPGESFLPAAEPAVTGAADGLPF